VLLLPPAAATTTIIIILAWQHGGSMQYPVRNSVIPQGPQCFDAWPVQKYCHIDFQRLLLETGLTQPNQCTALRQCVSHSKQVNKYKNDLYEFTINTTIDLTFHQQVLPSLAANKMLIAVNK